MKYTEIDIHTRRVFTLKLINSCVHTEMTVHTRTARSHHAVPLERLAPVRLEVGGEVGPRLHPNLQENKGA